MKSFKLILSFMLFVSLQVFPQGEVSVSKPELGYYNDTLLIMYDIRNCRDDALYKVKPLITSGGRVINAMSLSGDLGDSIKCGDNKRITWSLAADNLKINDNIEVQIVAEQTTVNKTEEGEKASPSSKDTEDRKTKSEPEDGIKERPASKPVPAPVYSRGNIIASSVIFPGLGQKKVTRKGAPLLMGILGYGSLAASGYFIYDYNKKYEQYLETDIRSESDILYQDADKSFNAARYLAYGAAGIWAVNLIWSALIPSSQPENLAAGVSVNDISGMQLYAKWTF